MLGVQWHAETLVGEAEQLALFERLVQAANAEQAPGDRRIEPANEEDSGAHAV